MIGSLRGTLVERDPAGEALIEVGGVGYRVQLSPAGLVALGEPGREVFVHVHHHVREDADTLYGFATRDERVCFEALLGAHGVGPALALGILSVHSPAELRRAVADDDLDALCLVPGVGRKTAARLALELKSRLAVPDVDLTVPGSADAADRSPLADVREALAGLGYAPDEVRAALRDLPTSGDPAALLREALQRLAAARA
ncbi:MAG: Holliday junction branch migration protein RuvA [Acidimicrobiales bacterium]|nr:Holliday junction branch migration protein RuvA [Acidimicrobiales bacterium]